jgi:hypothetical protein
MRWPCQVTGTGAASSDAVATGRAIAPALAKIVTVGVPTTGASATQQGGVAARTGLESLLEEPQLPHVREAACVLWDSLEVSWHEPEGAFAGAMHEMWAPKWEAMPPTRQ